MAEITNQLLKDAIADAETVRQTAIANAKIALEETFTPQIKAMLARRLRAGSSEGGEDSHVAPDAHPATVPAPAGAPTVPEAAKEEPLQDADPEGSARKEAPQGSSDIGSATPQTVVAPGAKPVEPSSDADSSSDIDQGGEGHGDSKNDWYDDWSESDFDLDEIIKELEGDVTHLEEGEFPAKDDEKEDEDEEGEEHEKAETPAEEKGEEEEKETPPAAEFGKKETDTIAKKGTDHPEAPAAKGADAEDDDLNIDELIKELEAADAEKQAAHDQMALQNQDLQHQLAQYKEALGIVRKSLAEVNLLNAKLLFTNKLFRKEGLSTEQKVAIVENFDRATTVREVKMVYTTLVETLNVTAKILKNRPKTTKVVAEGYASKVTASTAPKTEILEENAVAKRLKELAGIL